MSFNFAVNSSGGRERTKTPKPPTVLHPGANLSSNDYGGYDVEGDDIGSDQRDDESCFSGRGEDGDDRTAAASGPSPPWGAQRQHGTNRHGHRSNNLNTDDDGGPPPPWGGDDDLVGIDPKVPTGNEPRRGTGKRGTAMAKRKSESSQGGTKRSRAEVALTMASRFRCSITSSLCIDPVTTADGQLYDREAIERWLSKNTTSPNTGKVLQNKTLTSVPVVKEAIEQLILSGCLAAEETREWRVRRAIALVDVGKDAEAKPLLEQALADGEAAAGYHLSRLFLRAAADAGVAEAVADLALLQPSSAAASASASGGESIITSLSQVARRARSRKNGRRGVGGLQSTR